MVNKRLEDLLKKRSGGQISYAVHTKATYYPSTIKIYKPKTPFYRLAEGYELVKKDFTGALMQKR